MEIGSIVCRFSPDGKSLTVGQIVKADPDLPKGRRHAIREWPSIVGVTLSPRPTRRPLMRSGGMPHEHLSHPGCTDAPPAHAA